MAEGFELSPTMVLGLGSFGGKVVSILRTLVFEELGFPGLPVFRFINISTHEDGEKLVLDPPNQPGNKVWENLQILCAVIRDKGKLKNVLDENTQLYKAEPGWREWLDPQLLDMTETSYKAGAGNNRMIGRCCLWHNWNDEARIKINLLNGLQSIRSSTSLNTTNEILRDYLHRKTGTKYSHDDNFVQQVACKVYVVGSFCGGTNSGMFTDISYFLKSHGITDCFGLFSIPDVRTCGTRGAVTHAANTLSSLLELDFFMHDGTRYHTRFPLDKFPITSDDSPFGFVQLISPTSEGREFLVGQQHEIKESTLEELSFICATSLFFDLLSGVNSKKNAIKADFPKTIGFREPRSEGVGYLKYLSSIGAATAHYPKYRIAGSAGLIVMRDKMLDWLGRETSEDLLSSEKSIREKPRSVELLSKIAANWFHDAFNTSLNIIAGSGGTQTNLRQKWKTEYHNNFLPGGDPESINSAQLISNLKGRPPGEPIAERFMAGGEYERIIRGRLPEFRQHLYDLMQERFNASLEGILNLKTGQYDVSVQNLLELKDVIGYLLNEIDKFYDELESTPPNVPVDPEEMSGLLNEFRKAEKSTSASLLLCPPSVRKYYCRQVIFGFEKELDDAHNWLEDVCIREVFPALKQEIQSSLLNLLNSLITRMDEYLTFLYDNLKRLKYIKNYDNFLVVSRFGGKNINPDIVTCLEGWSETDWDGIINEMVALDEEKRSLKALLLRNSPTAIPDTLNQVADLILRKFVGKMHHTEYNILDGVNQYYRGKISFLAQRSQPMVELNSFYSSIFDNNPIKLIAGGSGTDFLVENLKFEKMGDFESTNAGIMSMDHMLHFYQEECGIALDELGIYDKIKDHYENAVKSSQRSVNIVHTHKDPSTFDIQKYNLYRKLTAEASSRPSIIRVARDLIPDLIFEKKPVGDGQELIFKWEERMRTRQLAYRNDDTNGFLWELVNYNEGYKNFQQAVQNKLKTLTLEELENYIRDQSQKIADKYGHSSNEMKDFDRFFTTDFADNKDTMWQD